MVNKHQFQLLAKAFRAGKISLSDFTEQAYNPPAGQVGSAAAKQPASASEADLERSSDVSDT